MEGRGGAEHDDDDGDDGDWLGMMMGCCSITRFWVGVVRYSSFRRLAVAAGGVGGHGASLPPMCVFVLVVVVVVVLLLLFVVVVVVRRSSSPLPRGRKSEESSQIESQDLAGRNSK